MLEHFPGKTVAQFDLAFRVEMRPVIPGFQPGALHQIGIRNRAYNGFLIGKDVVPFPVVINLTDQDGQFGQPQVGAHTGDQGF